MSGALAMAGNGASSRREFDTTIKVGKAEARAIDKLKPDYVVPEVP
ncbi:MAG: hypothetical protein IPO50_15150 [Sphingomonadales bacterium]|nr:hypothetical protein [Sphingomonadales bacterium]